MHTTELIEAMREGTQAEIEAIDAEIVRQEEYQRVELEYFDALRSNRVEEGQYTLARLRYRRAILAGEVKLVAEPAPSPTPEESAALLTGVPAREAA